MTPAGRRPGLPGRFLTPDGRAVVALAVAMFGTITAWRFLEGDPLSGVTFLYTVPVSLIAVAFGLEAGLGAAVLASVLTGVWAETTGADLGPTGYFTRTATFAAVAIVVGWQVRGREKLEGALGELVRKDPLTGAANLRAWEERSELELGRARRSGEPLCVAMLDIDKLKELNDGRGHAAGDALLAECVERWRTVIRKVDLLARLGGDEFGVLLPNCTADLAENVVRRMLAAAPSGHGVSAGIAEWTGDEEDLAVVVGRADAALYEAKARGGGIARRAEVTA